MVYFRRKVKITTLSKAKQAIELFFLKKSFLFFNYSLEFNDYEMFKLNHKEHKEWHRSGGPQRTQKTSFERSLAR